MRSLARGSSGEGTLVVRLDIREQFLHRAHPRLHGFRKRRDSRVAERELQPAGRGADAIEVPRLGEPGRRADHLLQRERGLLGLLDALRALRQSDRDEPVAQLVQLAAACTLLGELAHRRHGSRTPHGLAVGDRRSCAIEQEPRPLPSTRERAEVGALALAGLCRHDACELFSALGQRVSSLRNSVEIVAESHRAEHRLGHVAHTLSERTRQARALFAPLPASYDRWSRLLSLGQDPRWRRFLVSRVDAGPGRSVLDVATGTGAVAIELAQQQGCDVVGVDQSPEMLAEAERRVAAAGLGARIRLLQSRAEELPFGDGSFDGLTFTYLLRYVNDPAATLRELARVVRPGRTIAMLEFGVPRRIWRGPWELYVRLILPLAGRTISPGWHEVGGFLGESIRDFYTRYPLPRLLELWRDAGIEDVRWNRLSLGGGIVVWGRRGG
ncbi:MAG: class I SAM-dependent methyltransferase [Actinobacteria bacterium]|nr:class I SAM-dependent methyltransferase [Actinomycetota bacterium]